MADLLPVADYVERILATVSPLPAFPQPLMEALGLALAEDVVAPISLPSFDNSAMDGYAVVAEDVAAATEEAPVTLPVVGEIGAGQSSILALSPGTAVKIMTGAPVPAGATTVVPYEWTDRGVASVRIGRAATPGQHIRPTGDDISEGDMLLEEGTVLGPRHLGMLAAVGRATVRTRRCPRRRCDRLPRRHRARRDARLLRGAERPARPRRHRRHERRRERGRLRRREGVVVAPRLDVVRRRRHAARQAAGLRHRRRGRHPGLHPSRQPGLVLRLVRDVRAARDPPA